MEQDSRWLCSSGNMNRSAPEALGHWSVPKLPEHHGALLRSLLNRVRAPEHVRFPDDLGIIQLSRHMWTIQQGARTRCHTTPVQMYRYKVSTSSILGAIAEKAQHESCFLCCFRVFLLIRGVHSSKSGAKVRQK